MAQTQPRSEQIRFVSAATGSHVLDTYIENAERGGRTLASILSDIWDASGALTSGYLELQMNSAGKLQYRTGGAGAYTDIQDLFVHKGAWATTTVYNRTDTISFGGQVYICVTTHTSDAASFATDAANWVVALSLAGNPVYYRGGHDASTAAYPASPSQGDLYIATVAGTISAISYEIGDMMLYNGATWDYIEGNGADKLSKAGGTMTGPLTTTTDTTFGDGSTLGRTQVVLGTHRYEVGSSGGGASGSGNLIFSGWGDTDISDFRVKVSGAENNIWHAGNDGAGSGLDADLLDGIQGAAFAQLAGAAFTGNISTTGTGVADQGMPHIEDSAATVSITTARNGRMIFAMHATAADISIPLNATDAIPLGATFVVLGYGAGTYTIAPAVGVTVRSKDGNLVIDGQYSAVALTKKATDEWLAIGSLKA